MVYIKFILFYLIKMDKMHNPELLYNSFPLPWTLFSSNVNEVIRAVLIFFLRRDFRRTQSTKSTNSIKGTKSTKSIKSTKMHISGEKKQKTQRIKHLRGKKFIRLFTFLCFLCVWNLFVKTFKTALMTAFTLLMLCW